MHLRAPLSAYNKAQLCWSTQFNDLRNPSSLGTNRQARNIQLKREIKAQALFERRILIRDADIVNHADLLSFLLSEPDMIGTALLRGGHVLCLRRGSESFTEVNKNAGAIRAYPKRFQKLRGLVKRLDSALADSGVIVAEVDDCTDGDAFRVSLDRICKAPFLSEHDRELLCKAIARSTPSSAAGLLRFGDIYDYLVRRRSVSPHSELIQWCRAAHTLLVPNQLGIAPSTADRDISPVQVAFVLGRAPEETYSASQHQHLFPRRIISGETLDSLDFNTIMRFRGLASEIGYFDAVETLRASHSRAN